LQYFATANAKFIHLKKKYVNWTLSIKLQQIDRTCTKYFEVCDLCVCACMCVHTREKQRSVTSVCLIRV